MHPVDVGNMQVYLFVEHDQVFVHLDFQVEAACLNLWLEHFHLFFLHTNQTKVLLTYPLSKTFLCFSSFDPFKFSTLSASKISNFLSSFL
jgi:hypothetical protein